MSVFSVFSRVSRKSLIASLLALLAFAAADLWVWRTLEEAYTKTRDGRMRGIAVIHTGQRFEDEPYEHRASDDRLT